MLEASWMRDNRVNKETSIPTPICYPAELCHEFFEGKKNRRWIVEIGPGRGDFLFDLAERNKDSLVVAIEIKPTRFAKLVERINKRELKNILLIESDARKIFGERLKTESIDEIYINFPDPWPKRRHSKNRLFSPSFIEKAEEVLVKNGKLFFATDAIWYMDETKLEFKKSSRLASKDLQPSDIFPTFFAQKWLKMGRSITCAVWIK